MFRNISPKPRKDAVTQGLLQAVHQKRRSAVPQPHKLQADKFKDAARAAECDEDEARWDERLKKVAGQKPAPDKPRNGRGATTTRLLTAAAALAFATLAHARVPVMAPPPPPIELTPQEREARDQACRNAISGLFNSEPDRPEFLNVAARRAEAEHHIRAIREILTSSVLELRVYVVAMAQFDLAPDWIGTEPFYFQCRFGNAGEIIAVDVI